MIFHIFTWGETVYQTFGYPRCSTLIENKSISSFKIYANIILFKHQILLSPFSYFNNQAQIVRWRPCAMEKRSLFDQHKHREWLLLVCLPGWLLGCVDRCLYHLTCALFWTGTTDRLHKKQAFCHNTKSHFRCFVEP